MKKNVTLFKFNKKKNRGFFEILTLIAECIARFFKKSPIGFFFADLYTLCNKKWKNGFIYNFFRNGRKRVRKRATFSHIYEKSLINKHMNQWFNNVIHAQLRVWGVGLLFFSLSAITVTVLKWFIEHNIAFESLFINGFTGFFRKLSEINDPEIFKRLFLGISVAALSIPLIISKKEFGEALITNKLTRIIVVDVLNLSPTIFERSSNSDGNYLSTSMLSISAGSLTYILSPLTMIIVLCIAILFFLTTGFPEMGIICLITVLPFANILPSPYQTVLLVIILGFTTFGFVFKLLRAKRVLRFELIDVLVMAFGALLFFGGVFTYGDKASFWSAELYFVFFIIYFLIVNMYIGRSSIYRTFKILVISTMLVAMIGIISGGVLNKADFDSEIFKDMPGRVSAFLGNPNTLGAYFAIIFPLVLGLFVISKRAISKIMYFIAGAFIVVCTIMTASRGAWLGMIAGTALFLIVYNFKYIWMVITSLVALPFGVILLGRVLPQEWWIIKRVTTIYHGIITALGNTDALQSIDSSISYRFTIWENTFEMLKNNYISGVGVGEHAFRFIYEDSIKKGEAVVAHAHSLLLQILVSLGIVGLALFTLILFTYGQQCFTEIKIKERNSKSRTMIIAGLASISGAFVTGLTDYIWYNYRVFILFWIVMAVTVALVRNNVRERESTRIISNMTSANIEIDC